ncbi:MAG TPA: NAD-dependent epimerase/dehydratase family protein [Candidatus Mcinerneyibacteriales bacterium]|nr:NAD-dependent epimerase/dehydratase family protein [Candidatus Mcinerneyibacteriales bacterium]HPJ69870.1 NAD-dependent epimerase/dehydratase family protein [Candidatus Mcinerneyibacteriales bacterium]HPQ89412.1 NAD-dependent epimerase/dehydratase family protein [Candidatus Mcinerneyibacteriales bacterium]
MKNILVLGASGQIGSELVGELRKIYGDSHVVGGDINLNVSCELKESGPYEYLDIRDTEKIVTVIKKYNIDTIYNLVALLSAVGEQKPQFAWEINIGGLMNTLEIAREHKCAVFTPSSIGAFGPSTPPDHTPQDTIMRPTTIYGISKVAGEMLSDYYYLKYGVDTRSVRFPGLISYKTLPGGGTTDYAVEIFYEAVKAKKYSCPLPAGTFLDMMYMPDAVKAAIEIMEADPSKLKHRNSFNVTAMSFDPEILAAEIKKHIPEFTLSYDINPTLVKIANSWPNSMDDSCARNEWGWKPDYTLADMTSDMLEKLKEKLK